MIIDVIIPISFISCRLHELVIPAKAGIQAFPAGILRNRMGIFLISSCCGNSICHSRDSGNPVFRFGPLLSQG